MGLVEAVVEAEFLKPGEELAAFELFADEVITWKQSGKQDFIYG